jgi:tetratricopeptide (TPR) repeat protein
MSLSDDLPPTDSLETQPQTDLSAFGSAGQLEFDIGFFNRVLRRSPDYLDVLRCQGQLLSRRGLHDQALKIDRRVVALAPKDGVAHYNLGCSLALLGYAQEALQSLRRALESGYSDIDFLENDPDLDSLHKEPEYQDLLRTYGAAE